MDQISNTPGLHHIAESIFLNLDYKILLICQTINKSTNEILNDSMFWIKKWSMLGSLSKKNQEDWTKAIQMTRGTKLEMHVISYVKSICKVRKFLDIPCYINEEVIFKSKRPVNLKTFNKDDDLGFLYKSHDVGKNMGYFLGSFQLFASLKFSNWFKQNHIKHAAANGFTEVVKVLAPVTDNPNAFHISFDTRLTPIWFAACNGHTEIVKTLATWTENPNHGIEPYYPIGSAACNGHIEVVKYLTSFLLDDAHNKRKKIKIIEAARNMALQQGHQDIVRFLNMAKSHENLKFPQNATFQYI